MDRIAIIGVNIHGTDVAGLEGLRRPAPGEEVSFLRDLADELGASELVFLATCNRVEVVFAREEGEAPDEGDVRLVARFLAPGSLGAASSATARAPASAAGDGASPPWKDVAALLMLRTAEDAIHHLFRVAGSLDSLVVGEDQILHQVREAYGRASDIGLVGPLLGPLFHHALAVGKQVRSETDLARHPVSVVNLAVHALEEHGRARELQVAVLGAGEMGALLVRALSAVGIRPAYVVNRNPERALPLARGCGAEALALETFRRGEHRVDAVVSATSAPGLVLEGDLLRRLATRTPSGGPLLGVDLAVPRDLPDLDEEGLRILDLDDLRAVAARHKALRAQAAAAAEQLIDRKVDVFTRRFREEAAAPLVSEVRQAGEELLRKELAGLLGGRLSHLPEADQRAVERWARATFGRLMHMPTAALKRLAFEMGGGEDLLNGGGSPSRADGCDTTPGEST